MILTKEQRKAVKELYTRSSDGARTYKEFRKRAEPCLGLPCILIPWCGMFVGIEKDGLRHT